MSSCNCVGQTGSPELKKCLEAVDLWEPFERLLAARESSKSHLGTINKAERARALGLPKAIATSIDQRAARELAALARQLRGAREQLRATAKSKEWLERMKLIADQQASRQGVVLRKEHRESLIDGLLESDLSAVTVASALKVYDSVSETAHKRGIPGVLAWLDGELDREIKVLSAKRVTASPKRSAESIAACIGAVTAIYVVALAACAWVPFCWCCYSGALHLAYITMLHGCMGSAG